MDAYITGMTAAGTLTGSELLEVSQLSTSVTITAATISALASDNSYNDSGSGFVAAGFAVDDRVNVTGFTGDVANNIFVGKITALTTGKMTIGGTDGDVIVNDAAGESVTISKWVSRRATIDTISALISIGLLELKGDTDASGNPNYPAASKGDAYYVTVAGKVGGASGKSVDVGDVYVAKADNAGGTEAGVGTSWFVLEHNLSGVALLSGGTFTGDIEVPAEAYGVGWNGSNEAPTKNDVYDKIETVIGGIPGTYTDEMAQDAVGNILTDTGLAVVTYNDGGPSIDVNVPAAAGSDYRTGTDATKALTADSIWDAAAYVTLNDSGGNIAVDLSTGINFSMTMDGDYTLSAPSNGKPGQTGVIVLTQDGTGTQTLAYNAAWKFAGGTDPTLSTAASTVDLLFYQVLANGTDVYATLVKAIA